MEFLSFWSYCIRKRWCGAVWWMNQNNVTQPSRYLSFHSNLFVITYYSSTIIIIIVNYYDLVIIYLTTFLLSGYYNYCSTFSLLGRRFIVFTDTIDCILWIAFCIPHPALVRRMDDVVFGPKWIELYVQLPFVICLSALRIFYRSLKDFHFFFGENGIFLFASFVLGVWL